MKTDKVGATDDMSMQVGKKIQDEVNLGSSVNVHIQLFDGEGKLKDERFIHNLTTQAGKNAIADLVLAAPTLGKMTHMAIGTGAPTVTLLGAEAARAAFTTKTRAVNVVTVVGDFPAGVGTGAIIEAGTFDVATANTVNMWMSTTFGVITKTAADIMSITWTLTIN